MNMKEMKVKNKKC